MPHYCYCIAGVLVEDSLIQEDDSLAAISPYLRKIDPITRRNLWTNEKIIHLGTGYDAGENATQADGLIVHLLTFRDAGLLSLLNSKYHIQKV